MRCLVLSHTHQRAAARIAEDVLVYDYRAGKKVALEPWVEDTFRKVADEERRAAEHWLTRRTEVDRWLFELESESIHSGKAEDMGGTKS